MAKSPIKTSNWGARTEQRADRTIIRDWLSGSSAASPWVGFVFFVNIVATGYSLTDSAYDGISGRVFDVVAGLVAFSVFVLARVIRPWSGQARLRGNIFLWLVAGELAVAAPLLTNIFATGSVNPGLLQLTGVGIFSYPILIFVFALLYSGLRESRKTSRELARSRRSLVVMRDTLDADVALARATIVNEVEAQLRAGFQSLSETKNPDAQELRAVIDDVVRPLSWQLESAASHSSQSRAIAVPALTLTETRRSLFRRETSGHRYRVALGRLSSPALVGASFLIFALPASFFVFGLSGLYAGIATTAMLTLALWLTRLVAGLRHVSRTAGIVTNSAIAFISSLTFPVVLALGSGDAVAGASIVLVSVIITTAVGLFLGFVARRADAFAEAREINDDISALVTRLRQEVWVTRKQLARVVHGQVQGKLLAASLRLARSVNSDDSEIEREQAQQDVHDAVELVSSLGVDASTSNDRTVELELADLAIVWEGACQIDSQISEQARLALADDAVATSCVVEVIRETLSNAVKHARASRIGVEITLASRSSVLVVLRNPGQLLETGPGGSGYGTRILDDVTVKWGIAQSDDDVELRAEIALATR